MRTRFWFIDHICIAARSQMRTIRSSVRWCWWCLMMNIESEQHNQRLNDVCVFVCAMRNNENCVRSLQWAICYYSVVNGVVEVKTPPGVRYKHRFIYGWVFFCCVCVCVWVVLTMIWGSKGLMIKDIKCCCCCCRDARSARVCVSAIAIIDSAIWIGEHCA